MALMEAQVVILYFFNFRYFRHLLPPTINMKVAISLQKLLEQGLTFQLPQPQAENPFLTP